MKIRELFSHPIEREITTVIKVDDRSEAEVAQELREYVVTPRIEECLLAFFERYADTRDVDRFPTDKIGVWVYGFFGSGKSHLVKIIGHLLHNPVVEGQSALDIFLTRIAGTDHELELRGLLTQVHNFFDNHVVALQIKAEQDLINPDSISEILYRRYLESRGLSRDPWIGRLELGLIRQGVYDAFRAQIQALEKRPWEEVRDDYLIVRSSIVRALRAVLPERYPTDEAADKALEDLRTGLRMGPTELARELMDFVEERQVQAGERSAHLVFIIDEIGQFIGDDDQKLGELQAIAEQFGIHGRGRLWLIVTAQEKLEDVVEGVKRKRATFAKIIDRFDTRLELTSENIERVVEERILKKRPQGEVMLRDLYRKHQGTITLVGRLVSARQLPLPDEERFIRDYPFLPYHFHLMQQAFASLRAKGGATLQLTGSERSMIGVVQGVLKSPQTGFADAIPGRLVTLDEIYDQIDTEVPSYDRRSINEVSNLVPDSPLPPIKVLKALFVLQHVEWAPRTLDNIARLLMPDVDTDFQVFREQVKETLHRLQEARYITEVDGLYKYLSVAERSIEEEIAAEKAGNNDVRREARKIMRELLSGMGRLNYESGLTTFDIRILADGAEIRSTGDITLEVYSPIGMDLGGQDPEAIRDVLSPAEDRTVYWLPGPVSDLVPNFKRLIRIEAVVRRRKGNEQSTEEVIIIREKETEAELLRERLKSAISRALIHGQIIYGGEPTILDGRTTNLNTIFNRELSRVIPHVYTKFHMAKVRVSEGSIEKMLTAPPTQLRHVEPDLDLWDEQGHIKTHLPVVQEVLDELKRRREYGQPADGRSLAAHFGGVPYGWNHALLRVVLAALFRAGIIGVWVRGTYYPDPGPRPAREALVRMASFNKALFDYDPEGGLSLEERKQAQHYLDVLFDRKVDDTTHTLYRTLQDELEELKAQNERLRLQAERVGLPVKELLYQGEALLEGMLEQPRPPQVVRAFLEQYEPIRELIAYHNKLSSFIAKGRLEAYRRAVSLLGAVDKARALVPDLATETVQKQVADLRTLIEQREVVGRWDDYFFTVYQDLLTAYQKVYAALYAKRTQVYQAVARQVAQFGMVPSTITEMIVEHPGSWAEDGLTYAGDRATLVDLYYQIRDAEQRKVEAIEKLQRKTEIDKKKAVHDVKHSPVMIKVRDYLPSEVNPGEVSSFKKKVEALTEQVEKVLRAGRKVILG